MPPKSQSVLCVSISDTLCCCGEDAALGLPSHWSDIWQRLQIFKLLHSLSKYSFNKFLPRNCVETVIWRLTAPHPAVCHAGLNQLCLESNVRAKMLLWILPVSRCDSQDETDCYNMLVHPLLARQLLRYKQPTGHATAVHSSWAWTLVLFDLVGVVEGEAEDGEEVDFYPPFYSAQGKRYQWLEREGASIETYHKSVLWVSLYDIPSVAVSGSPPPQ